MFFGIKINLKNFTKTAIRNKILCTFAVDKTHKKDEY